MSTEAQAESRDDSELVEAAVRGESSAFDEIVRRHGGMVIGLGVRTLGSRTEADDLFQEVFLRVFRSLARFEGRASLKTWIARITVNTARNRRRSARRRRAHLTTSIDVAAHEDTPPPSESLPDTGAGPDREVLSREASDRLEAALRELPDEFREAILLREIEGLSYDEIAETLSVSLGTVKSRIARARQRLQQALPDLHGAEP